METSGPISKICVWRTNILISCPVHPNSAVCVEDGTRRPVRVEVKLKEVSKNLL